MTWRAGPVHCCSARELFCCGMPCPLTAVAVCVRQQNRPSSWPTTRTSASGCRTSSRSACVIHPRLLLACSCVLQPFRFPGVRALSPHEWCGSSRGCCVMSVGLRVLRCLEYHARSGALARISVLLPDLSAQTQMFQCFVDDRYDTTAKCEPLRVSNHSRDLCSFCGHLPLRIACVSSYSAALASCGWGMLKGLTAALPARVSWLNYVLFH